MGVNWLVGGMIRPLVPLLLASLLTKDRVRTYWGWIQGAAFYTFGLLCPFYFACSLALACCS